MNTFADEVVVHFNVCSSGVKHGVASEVDAAHIVVEDAVRILDGNAQVLQDSLEPYGFAGGDCRAPVFGFRARQCDGWLLLATPGDRSTAEGENESGCGSSVRFVACPVRVCVSFKSNGRVRLDTMPESIVALTYRSIRLAQSRWRLCGFCMNWLSRPTE